MRQSFMGFDQKAATEYGLKPDHQFILRWFLDWQSGGDMIEKRVEGNIFYWINWQTVLEQLPALGVSSRDSIKRRLQQMQEKDVLEKHTDYEQGTRTYYRVVPAVVKALTLRDSAGGNGTSASGGKAEAPDGVGQDYPTKDSAVKDGTDDSTENNPRPREEHGGGNGQQREDDELAYMNHSEEIQKVAEHYETLFEVKPYVVGETERRIANLLEHFDVNTVIQVLTYQHDCVEAGEWIKDHCNMKALMGDMFDQYRTRLERGVPAGDENDEDDDDLPEDPRDKWPDHKRFNE